MFTPSWLPSPRREPPKREAHNSSACHRRNGAARKGSPVEGDGSHDVAIAAFEIITCEEVPV